MVRVDVRHERVPGAVHALADDATVLFLPLGVLVRDVALQGRLRAQHLTTELAREHLLGRCPCNSKTKLAMVQSARVATSRIRTRGRGPGPPPPSHHVPARHLVGRVRTASPPHAPNHLHTGLHLLVATLVCEQ